MSNMVPILQSVTPSTVEANGMLTLWIHNIMAYNASDPTWTEDLQVVVGSGGMCVDIQQSGPMEGTAIIISCRSL